MLLSRCSLWLIRLKVFSWILFIRFISISLLFLCRLVRVVLRLVWLLVVLKV